MWRKFIHKAGFIILVGVTLSVATQAQNATDTTAPVPNTGGSFTPQSLDQLLKPVALYPDPLLAQIFAAATLPSEIVLADRYVNQGGDVNQAAQQPWDPSVQALVHYPTVLKWLDDNLPWTTEVGQAFVNQQQDVMDSVQRLRSEAQAQGNLQTTPQENIVSDDGTVEIEPADPNMIYVPNYAWDTIYTEPGIYCGFGVGFPIGLWLGFDWDWHHHHIIAWGPGHLRPAGWWRLAPSQRIAPRGAPLWHPSSHSTVLAHGPDRGFGDTVRSGRVNMPGTPAPAEGFAARQGQPARGNVGNAPGGAFRGTEPSHEITPGNVARPPTEIARPPAEIARPAVSAPIARSAPAPEIREAPGVSAFGGPDSSSQARAASARGAQSMGPSGGGGGRRR
jgi:Protein of unknown function (DUF3300)